MGSKKNLQGLRRIWRSNAILVGTSGPSNPKALLRATPLSDVLRWRNRDANERSLYNAAMKLALVLHPDSRCTAAMNIDVEVARSHFAHLLLQYRVTGTMSDLRIPSVTASARGDELWRHTCFEAFVRAPPSAAYSEFNFSPTTQWAAYRFSGYRNGIRVESDIIAPRVEVQSNDACYQLQAALELDRVPHLPRDAAWQLGLSAVVEETSGRKSYWALAHPPGKPDFHHSDCFVHELPAA